MVLASNVITLARVNDGATGNGVSKTEVYYYLSTSNTSQTGGSWSTTVPDWVNGRYYWMKVKTTYTSGSTAESSPVCITGAQGETGSTGTGVDTITTEFYLSTSKTSQTGGSWVTTMPTWSSGAYLWTRNKIVYKNPSSTVYTTPVCDSSWEAVNEIEIGGRNLIRNTGTFKNVSPIENIILIKVGEDGEKYVSIDSPEKNWHHVVFRPYVPLTMIDGKTITVSFEARSPEYYDILGQSDAIYATLESFESESTYNTRISKIDHAFSGSLLENGGWTKIEFTFNCNVSEWYVDDPTRDASYFSLVLYNNTASIIEFRRAKVEIGNKATAWTPAPEDVEDGINDAQSTADQALSTAESNTTRVNNAVIDIDALKATISSLVTGQNGESLMTQTETGWTFSLANVLNTLNSATNNINSLNSSISATNNAVSTLNSTVNDLGRYTNYIKFGTDNGKPCIILGETDSAFKVIITNTDIRFMEGSSIPASISNQSLYIGKAVIREELRQGNFVWMARNNGNYGLLWKGE